MLLRQRRRRRIRRGLGGTVTGGNYFWAGAQASSAGAWSPLTYNTTGDTFAINVAKQADGTWLGGEWEGSLQQSNGTFAAYRYEVLRVTDGGNGFFKLDFSGPYAATVYAPLGYSNAGVSARVPVFASNQPVGASLDVTHFGAVGSTGAPVYGAQVQFYGDIFALGATTQGASTLPAASAAGTLLQSTTQAVASRGPVHYLNGYFEDFMAAPPLDPESWGAVFDPVTSTMPDAAGAGTIWGGAVADYASWFDAASPKNLFNNFCGPGTSWNLKQGLHNASAWLAESGVKTVVDALVVIWAVCWAVGKVLHLFAPQGGE